MPILQQVQLSRGPRHMLAWVDASFKLRLGMVVVDKDGEEWNVDHAYELTLNTEDLNRGWKVGGIDAPVRKSR